jgi:hypothetical protein
MTAVPLEKHSVVGAAALAGPTLADGPRGQVENGLLVIILDHRRRPDRLHDLFGAEDRAPHDAIARRE